MMALGIQSMEAGNTPPDRLARGRLSVAVAILVVVGAVVTTLALLSKPDSSPEGTFGRLVIPPRDPVRLGTLLAISGENASLGIDSQQGAVLAAQLRGPVLGRRVRLIPEDDGCSGPRASAAARALLQQAVVAVVGPSCSSAVNSARSILGKRGVLLVSPSATRPDLTESRTTYFARTVYNSRLLGAAGARFARYRELQAKTAAVVMDGTPYATELAEEFAETFEDGGGTVVARVAIFRPGLTGRIVREIASRRPDVVFAPISGSSAGSFTRRARQVLSHSELMFGEGVFRPGFFAAAGTTKADGVYVVGADPLIDSPRYETEFVPAYRKAFGEEPQSLYHAQAFDATNMILDALERVAARHWDGTLVIDRQSLRDAFLSISNYEGLSGRLGCDRRGDCGGSPNVIIYQICPDHCPWWMMYPDGRIQPGPVF
jgi:branched-chain amino acid transport system substrate-binding protein